MLQNYYKFVNWVVERHDAQTVEKECNNGKFGVTIEYGIAMRKASNRWIMDIVHEAVNDMRDRKGR